MVCDQMAMGLPLVTSVLFLKAKSFWYNVGVSEVYLRFVTPSGIKHECYV
jgi:hypothetical protein